MRRVSKIVTPPTVTPVSVAEAKLHMGIAHTADDTLIGIYVNAATLECEAILQRKLISQTWKMWLDYWPAQIDVLFGDLQSVTHVKYTDTDAVQSTFSATLYDVDTNSVPGRIVLKDGETWPNDALNAVNPIEIQFITGFGATSASVPEDIRSAILLTVAHKYENRENYVIGFSGGSNVLQIPGTAQSLLANHRIWRWVL